MAVMLHRFTSSTTVNSVATRSAHEDAPPLPTSNNLDAAQRSRYIRTARKLGKVLGATPLIMDSISILPALTPTASRASHTLSAPSTPSTPHFDLAGTATPSRKSLDSVNQVSTSVLDCPILFRDRPPDPGLPIGPCAVRGFGIRCFITATCFPGVVRSKQAAS